MTSKNDILRWLELEDIRLNKRIEDNRNCNPIQEYTSLSGSLLTVQTLLKLIRSNKIKDVLVATGEGGSK